MTLINVSFSQFYNERSKLFIDYDPEGTFDTFATNDIFSPDNLLSHAKKLKLICRSKPTLEFR